MQDTFENQRISPAVAAERFLTEDYAGAKRAYADLYKEFPENQDFLANFLQSCLRLNELDENVVGQALDLFEKNKASSALLSVLAQIYMREDMNAEATDILENIRTQDEDNIPVVQNLAQMYRDTYEGDKLESLIKSVFPKYARDERILCLAATYAYAFGNTRQADFLYKKALKKNRAYVLRRENFYDFLLTQRKNQKVIRYARESLKTFPDDVFVKEALLTALIRTEHIKDAEELFDGMNKNLDRLSDEILVFWAETLSHSRKYDEAFDTAFRVSPSYEHYDSLYFFFSKMLYFMRETGMIQQSLDRAQKWRDAFPDDVSVRHACAAVLGKTDTPTPSPDFARKVFDNMAEDFDYVLLENLKYKGPDFAEKLLSKSGVPELKSKAVLDLGCGTGLLGKVLKRYSKKFGMLTGVDVSPKMLDVARKKAVYDRLEQQDILTYLKNAKVNFDIIACMDVFVYFGDVQPVLQSVHNVLKKDGVFLFSVVSGVDNRPYTLEPSGRYVHYVPYITALLETMEFEIVKQDEVCLRKELNKPVLSTVFLVRKP